MHRILSRRAAILVLTGVTSASCAAERRDTLPPEHVEAIRDSVGQFMASIPGALATDGPEAWLRFFDAGPTFFMASDGQIAFPGIDSAAAFLANFDPSVSAMELVWQDLRIDPLAPGLSSVAAAYHETITDTTGTSTSFGGFMTGLARHSADGWSLQHLHWSSPVPPRH